MFLFNVCIYTQGSFSRMYLNRVKELKAECLRIWIIYLYSIQSDLYTLPVILRSNPNLPYMTLNLTFIYDSGCKTVCTTLFCWLGAFLCVAVTLYNCSVGRSDCSQCHTADQKYDCVWCGEGQSSCVHKETCSAGVRDTCPAPVILSVSYLESIFVLSTNAFMYSVHTTFVERR